MRSSQRSAFSSGQPQQQSFVQTQPPSRQQQQRFTQPNDYVNNPNNMPQLQQTRMISTGVQNPTIQQSSNIPTNTYSSSSIPTVSPQDGLYTIILVRSAAEFYGLSETREAEFRALSKHLADYYNDAPNDASLNVPLFIEGIVYVIQEGGKFYRVILKHRESESRISVKLIDRGDEILVDTSELLQIDKRFGAVPPFAQPFRLRGYDESQNSASTTLGLKKLILNQRVHISPNGPVINGFYPVEVTLNNQSVNKMLLSNEKNLSVPSTTSNNRPNFNQPPLPPPTHITSQVFSNSSRHHSAMSHDLSGRLDMNQRTNDFLPTPQKLLTGAARAQPGRFGATTNQVPPPNEQIPHFSNLGNRNQQAQPPDSTPANSMWNKDQNNKPGLSGSGFSNQQTFGRPQQGSSQSSINQRTDDNKPSTINNQNRLALNNADNQQSSVEQKRPFSGGYSHDDRNEKATSENHFQQNNNGNNDSGFRRGGLSNRGRFSDRGGGGFSDRGDGGFSDRGGGGFPDRRGRGGFNDRNMNRNNDENNNENTSQSSGGYQRRTGDFTGRGGRGGSFPERNGANRSQGDDHSQNFSSNRGEFRGGRGSGGREFPNRRDQGDNGNFEQRRGRDGPRGGGSYGSFPNRDDNDLRLSSDTKTFSGWPNSRSTPANFEAGDRFMESEIPKETFKFVVSEVETANQFFIQLLSKTDAITSLSEALQTEYKQSPEMKLSLFQPNQACLAKNADGCWYRAIVLSTGVSKLKIRFIDFGDTTDVDSSTIRQIAKKHCAPGPYAYQCTFKNAQVVETVNTASIINKCVGKEFTGKITTKTSDGKFILESEDLLNVLLELNAIKLKSEVTLKRIKCLIGHIEVEQQGFYIQDDEKTLDEITELIRTEEPNAPALSLDEVKQLEPKSMVIARYEDEPFRGIIQSDESDENVNICFVDYGNTSSCPKNSLKRCSEQLSSYAKQVKHCNLYGIASSDITKALEYLGDNSEAENNLEISIINEQNQIYNVLVYINNQCVNEKFGYDPNNDQPSTTVKEQEQLTSVAEQPINEDVLLPNESSTETPEVIQSEIEETSPKYRQGVLTHVEKSKPYVYLQLSPEAEPIIEQINELIESITQQDKRNPSYEIGDHVIAQFTEDENYYRARIESYSSTTQLYTVYFLDFGNVDENVPLNHLYSYSDDLNQIEPQAHGYLLDKITSKTWEDVGRSLVEKNLNEVIEFYFSDENNSVIHMKFDDENDIYNIKEDNEQIQSPPSPPPPTTTEQNKTFQAYIIATDNDCFYIHILPDGNLHACEIEETLQIRDKEHQDSWSIGDLCIVSNEQNQYYRGQILTIDEKKYDVKRIDYGNILQDISDDHLYVLPDEEIYKQSPLAHQCRLHGVDHQNQMKAIEEVIKNIQPTERVTITVENDQNDQCLFVKLIRENNETVNDRYLFDNDNTAENENKHESDTDEKNEIISPDSPDSAIADTVNTDEQLTTPSENTNPSSEPINATENNSLLSVTNNQTIDFGENDPSTTIKDETNHSISSN